MKLVDGVEGGKVIEIELPEEYAGISSTIAVFLHDGIDESFYYLSIHGEPKVEEPEVPEIPEPSITEPEVVPASVNDAEASDSQIEMMP